MNRPQRFQPPQQSFNYIPQQDHVISCCWIPGTLDKVVLLHEGSGEHLVVAAPELLRLTTRRVLDELYLRGHANFRCSDNNWQQFHA